MAKPVTPVDLTIKPHYRKPVALVKAKLRIDEFSMKAP
jgi:hypothetical protein